jgi:hypothetical protein
MPKIHAASRLGDYLVAFKIATRSRIDEIRTTLKPTQMLGHALVQAGVLDHKTCEKVALVQSRLQKTAKELAKEGVTIALDEKTFVGEILIALGYLTPAENRRWLDYQNAKRARGEDPGRLGELLVDNGVCRAEDRDLAMQVQNWLRGVR